MDRSIITARQIRKHYDKFVAVDGIDFDIPKGKCFGFLGPNGAGKTTTLRLILGLTPLTAGDLYVFGLSVNQRARDIRARIGVVPQLDNLDPDFSVIENLRMYASYFGLPKSETERRIEHLVEFAALSDRRHAKTDSLSGGMKRRLTIARALVNQPELVVLDEPTTGLDPQARHVIWSRLMELREQGTTLLLSTHYMEEAERLCDELVIMDQGRILDQGAPKDLVARHLEPEVIEVRGSGAVRFLPDDKLASCRLERIGSSLYCYTADPHPLLLRLQKNHELTYIHRPTGLEDVFLRLTGRALRD